MMQGLGGQGETVERPEELRPALDRGFTAEGPYLINVLMDPGSGGRQQQFGWLDRKGAMSY